MAALAHKIKISKFVGGETSSLPYHITQLTNKEVLRFYLFHSNRLGGGNKLKFEHAAVVAELLVRHYTPLVDVKLMQPNEIAS